MENDKYDNTQSVIGDMRCVIGDMRCVVAMLTCDHSQPLRRRHMYTAVNRDELTMDHCQLNVISIFMESSGCIHGVFWMSII